MPSGGKSSFGDLIDLTPTSMVPGTACKASSVEKQAVELSTLQKPLSDGFDELAACSRPQTTPCSPEISEKTAGCASGNAADDPLAGLWAGSPDPLGASTTQKQHQQASLDPCADLFQGMHVHEPFARSTGAGNSARGSTSHGASSSHASATNLGSNSNTGNGAHGMTSCTKPSSREWLPWPSAGGAPAHSATQDQAYKHSSSSNLGVIGDDTPSRPAHSGSGQPQRQSSNELAGRSITAADSGSGSASASQHQQHQAFESESNTAAGGQGTSGASGGQGAAAGASTEQRELLIYAVPLVNDRLVFLPITAWEEAPAPPPEGIAGKIVTGFGKIGESMTNFWQSWGTKDPNTIQHKIYRHGQAVIENMSAEERLMRNIPKAATKVVVYHPTSISPTEVQEQLTKMTSTYCVKSAGKAAAAGLLLPVAVGIEIIAVPGTGWYTLYQLYKASTSAQGGSRLNKYLNHDKDVRVCYAGDPRLDKYIDRARLSPDGLLTADDVDDLCHELGESGLQHPLSELRARYLKRMQKHKADYALLPVNDVAADDDRPFVMGR